MVTIGAALQRRGHELLIVSGSGPGLRLALEAKLPYKVLPSSCYKSIEFNWKDYPAVCRIIKSFRPDIAQSFANGIPALLLASRREGTRIIATHCGGKPRRIMPHIKPVIVFSQELKINMIDLGIAAADVHVIPGRMELIVPQRDEEVERFFVEIGIPFPCRPLIFMICRLDVPKLRALRHFFCAAESYAHEGGPGTFVLIGQGKDTRFVAEMTAMVAEINARAGRQVLIITQIGSDSPAKFLHIADIVIGMGRSAFEGMVIGKPTLVLSNEGFGGVVLPDTVDMLANHNFTARGTVPKDAAATAQAIGRAISDLHNNPGSARDAGVFAGRWVRDNIDVEFAADQYERIYKTVLVGSKDKLDYLDLAKNIFYETSRAIAYRGLQQLTSRRSVRIDSK